MGWCWNLTCQILLQWFWNLLSLPKNLQTSVFIVWVSQPLAKEKKIRCVIRRRSLGWANSIYSMYTVPMSSVQHERLDHNSCLFLPSPVPSIPACSIHSFSYLFGVWLLGLLFCQIYISVFIIWSQNWSNTQHNDQSEQTCSAVHEVCKPNFNLKAKALCIDWSQA